MVQKYIFFHNQKIKYEKNTAFGLAVHHSLPQANALSSP